MSAIKVTTLPCDAEMDRYVEVVEQVAADPDAPVPHDYHGLLKKFAVEGAMVGLRHRGPVLISVDKAFLDAACGEPA